MDAEKRSETSRTTAVISGVKNSAWCSLVDIRFENAARLISSSEMFCGCAFIAETIAAMPPLATTLTRHSGLINRFARVPVPLYWIWVLPQNVVIA
jgi:hypothetical protein